MAIFHDRFRDFKDEVRELMMTEQVGDKFYGMKLTTKPTFPPLSRFQSIDAVSMEARVRGMLEEELGVS